MLMLSRRALRGSKDPRGWLRYIFLCGFPSRSLARKLLVERDPHLMKKRERHSSHSRITYLPACRLRRVRIPRVGFRFLPSSSSHDIVAIRSPRVQARRTCHAAEVTRLERAHARCSHLLHSRPRQCTATTLTLTQRRISFADTIDRQSKARELPVVPELPRTRCPRSARATSSSPTSTRTRCGRRRAHVLKLGC